MREDDTSRGPGENVGNEARAYTADELNAWLQETQNRLQRAAQAKRDQHTAQQPTGTPFPPGPIEIVGFSRVVEGGGGLLESDIKLAGMDHANVKLEVLKSGHMVINTELPKQAKQAKGEALEKAIKTELERCVDLMYKMYQPHLTEPKTFHITSVNPPRFSESARDMLLTDNRFEFVWYDGERWKWDQAQKCAVIARPEKDVVIRASEVNPVIEPRMPSP